MMVLRSIHIVYIFHKFVPFYCWIVFCNISLILFVHLFFTLGFLPSLCLLQIICYEPNHAWKHPVAASWVPDQVETPFCALQALSPLAFLTSSLVLSLAVLFSGSLVSSPLPFSALQLLCCFHVGPFTCSSVQLEYSCFLQTAWHIVPRLLHLLQCDCRQVFSPLWALICNPLSES